MADIRINALATTAASTASDDFVAVDGSANGTRKLNAYSPTFGGNLTVNGAINAVGQNIVVSPSSGTAKGRINSDPSRADVIQVGSNWTGGAQDDATKPSWYWFFDSRVAGDAATLYRVPAGGLSTSALAISSTGATFGGNLTVSGGTISSGTASLTLKSTSNTVVLQSAGTTALTLDSSQNATFAGKVTAGNWADVVSARLGVATSANFFTATIANNASSGGAYALRLHTTGTASSDYIVVGSSGASAGSIRFLADGAGNFVVNNAAIATTATDGFLYVATCAGTPTGTPTSYTGRAPIVVDTTNNKLYFYSSGTWRDAGP